MAHRFICLLGWCMLLLTPAVVTAQSDNTWLTRTQHKLDSLCAEPLLTESQLGLCVLDMTAGMQVYQRGARQRLRPASTMKLVTAITAMSTIMGDADCFSLRCWSEPSEHGTTLTLVGGMDPLLCYDDLLSLADTLVVSGITRVDNIWLDVSLADTTRWGEGWCWDDESEALTPFFYNSHRTAERYDNPVRQTWSKQPEATFVNELREAFASRGISIRGRVQRCIERRASRTPQGALRGTEQDGKTFVTRIGHAWNDVLVPMMKNSNNRYAEAMLWQLGLTCDEACPSLRRICQPFDSLCVQLGLDRGAYRIADGSGRSLYNYVTVELLCRMLNHAALQPWFMQLYESLPVMGVDGTLKRRLIGTTAQRNVMAKTGSVTGVSSLAGYAVSSEGHLLCFAIINQGVRTMTEGRDFQDAVCRIITE